MITQESKETINSNSTETNNDTISYNVNSLNKVNVSKDNFTKAITIKGVKYGGDWLGFKLGNFRIKFENIAGKNHLIFIYDKKDININKKYTLHLLLGDDSIITLTPLHNPIISYKSEYGVKYEVKFLVLPKDMIKLEKENFVKWQISNEESIPIEQGFNTCKLISFNEAEKLQMNSYEVFQCFMKEFNKVVNDNISEEDLYRANNLDIKDSGTCYVYLMIDTTNNFHKIGISNSPKYREHTLQSDKPTIELLCAKEYPSRAIAEAIESALHKTYASKRIRGEWFNLDSSEIEELKQTLK